MKLTKAPSNGAFVLPLELPLARGKGLLAGKEIFLFARLFSVEKIVDYFRKEGLEIWIFALARALPIW
jgi:hypothetical protein